jgi:hypothetical protein
VPATLEAVCLKAMAKRPADRYSTAAEFARALQRAIWRWRLASPDTVVAACVASLMTAILITVIFIMERAGVPTGLGLAVIAGIGLIGESVLLIAWQRSEGRWRHL